MMRCVVSYKNLCCSSEARARGEPRGDYRPPYYVIWAHDFKLVCTDSVFCALAFRAILKVIEQSYSIFAGLATDSREICPKIAWRRIG